MIEGVVLIIRPVLNDTAVMSSEDVKKCYVGMSLSTKVLARFALWRKQTSKNYSARLIRDTRSVGSSGWVPQIGLWHTPFLVNGHVRSIGAIPADQD
jgi:hypothetical protein